MKTTTTHSLRMWMLCIVLFTAAILLAASINYSDFNLSGSFLNLLFNPGLFTAFVAGSLILYSCMYLFNFLIQIKEGFYKQWIKPVSWDTGSLTGNSFQPNASISTNSNINVTNSMSKFTFLLVGLTICIVGFTSNVQAQLVAESPLETRVKETLKQNAEVLRFMENKGQLENKNILYYLNGKQGSIYIEKDKIRFVAKDYLFVKNEKTKETDRFFNGAHQFTLNMEHSNPNAKVVLGKSFGTKYNFFIGDDQSKWVSGVQAAKDITLEEVYPGIDIRLYSNQDGSLEFDWIVDPGADYKNIDLRFEGQDKLSVSKDGSLNVGLRFTDVKFHIPETYQVTEAGKVPLDFAFNVKNNKNVSFKSKSKIDPNYPTVIDPVLSWGTFMDGNDPDFDQYLFAIQVDPNNGMVYCAGATNRNIPTGSAPYDADGYLNSISGFGTGATPRVAIVYRVNSTGSDLVDLTMYGPSTVSGTNTVVAYGVSLSTNRVFIGGRTTVDGLPMAGTPFDNSFDNNDGFVAVFSRDLGTLHYSTYLGGTGSEDLGVTSIRAIDDNTFVCGLTAEASLPGAYISGGAAQTGFGGASDMWVGKFTSLNNLSFGTYVGGSGTEIFNDLELFADGRVAFAGSGTGSLTEVNSAAGRSTGSDFDGIIGVLNSTGTGFNYLDEIGGAGDDKINDCGINGSSIYWTGSSSDGFPTSSGAFSSTNEGGLDVVVGSVSDVGGAGSYKATLYGGGGDDIGSAIKRVAATKCDGTETAFLLVFGTNENNANGIPTVNINGDPFYDATNNGGLDIFFAGFNDNMTSLQYATTIGGQYNDYLGDTGEPRGGNHLWVKGANVYCGTTTHSASHSPTIVANTGFDQVKTNHANPTSDDTHVLFSIQFTSLFETDYSDAPSSYGVPSHILDCSHIRINTLDAETGAVPGVNANGDDNAGIDDEDGISTFPIYQSGGPQNISITVNSVMNSTGFAATLYGWIDLNNDGNFDNNEIATASVANGFSGSKTLTWSSVTVTGNPSNQYLRLRLTTDALADDVSTTGLDERSTESAENGEVEDYYICVKPKAGADQTVNCLASFPGGTATMAASGTGTWSAGAGNPGTALIVTPGSPTTVINSFSAAGTYTFVWTNATSCATDTALVTVTAKPNAGGNQSVNCVANFPGGSATMGATGVGTWTAQGSNPGTATITSPNSPTTTIVNYTVAGSYNFIWTNTSGCSDTATITVTAKPNAGVDKNVSCVPSFPGGSTAMAASGSGTWTAHPSNQSSNIVTPGSPTTTINTFAGEGTYLYIWTAGSCTDTAAVIVSKGPVGSASPQSICSGATSSVALNSTVPGSTFTWTAAQQSGAAITGFSDCNTACGTTIAQTLTNTTNNASGVVRYTVIPTAPNGCVGSSFTVDVTVNPKPVGSGTNQSICSGATTSIALSSTVASSTFTWTAAQLSGSTITGFTNCAAACGTSIAQTLTNTSNATPGVVRYTVTPTSPNGCAGNPFTIDVTVNPKPTGSANAETICSGSTTSVALSSTVAGSSFTWTAAQQSGATITGFSNCAAACGTTISQALTNTTNNNAGVVRYTVTTTSPDGCTGSTFQVSVTVNPKPGVSVTTTPACIGVSNGTATAVVTGGSAPFSYDWSNGQTSATITNLANATYTVTVEDNNNCTNTASGTVQQQGISAMTANPSACNPATNTYSVSGSLTLVNPPASGTLTVSIGASQQVFNAPFNSPTNYTITGLTADGAVHTVNAVFSAGSQCSKSTTYTAPVNCQPIITHSKSFVSATQTGAHSFSVVYTITVGNTGGDGQYDLKDVPGFDDDIAITSASFTTNAPGNPGGALAGTGPWTLANDQAILTGQTHTYTLTVNVTIDLSVGSSGNNSYTKCGTATPGNPTSGEGLYNESRLDTNNDGTPEETKKACGDIPYLDMTKSVASINPLGGNMYNVLYTITVKNLGGANGQYDLTDAPAFENDITIGSASYTSNAPGNAGSALAGTGPWILASDQGIIVGATHTYTLTVKVTLDLAGGGGDNVYTKCGAAIPGDPSAGEGLYNQSKMDTNNDGTNDETDEACGDLPYITTTKSVSSIIALGGNMYNVIYSITAQNIGGATGQYDLSDVPGFDDDITIGSASFTTNAPGNPGGALAGTGPWTLANDQNISAGATHTYTLTVKVTLDLRATSGGNNVYTKCGTATPGDPAAGEGLYNQSKMDSNNDGTPEETREACADLPYIVNTKSVASISPLGGNMYNVAYTIQVKNLGGVNGSYDLVDAPGFDNDFAINSAAYTSNAPGNPGLTLVGTGPWTLANDQNIVAGATHTYTLTVKVTLDLTPGSGGDNVYTKCGNTNPGDPQSGEGLYNQSRVDSNNDGIAEDTSEVCSDVPYVTSNKSITTISPLGGNMYNVNYTITVQNLGGANGQYDLKDIPGFDDDITINTASYTSNAPGNAGSALAGTGPWTLANDQSILVGATHTYTLTVKVTLDLTAGTGGNNTYTKCGTAIPGDPSSGEGLYNQSTIDTNNDGVVEETKEACGDLPYIVSNKTLTSISPLGGNMYNVVYSITTQNLGGANGQYDLSDVPGFDDDFTINSASYVSNAPGNGGSALAGTGPWTLANDQAITAGSTHTYTLTVKVTLNLRTGSGGDNTYTKCGNAIPGDPTSGEGLYNQSKLDTNNDGTPEDVDEVCGDVPYITNIKSVSSVTPLGGNMYTVVYQVLVKNSGGANGQYDLIDAPGFDDDFTINSASYASNAPGNPGAALVGSGPWTLSNDQAITAGATHTYTITVKVTLDLSAGSGGNNVYTKCGSATPGDPTNGEGLYNRSTVDVNNDGIPEDTSEVCTDLSYITSTKTIASIVPLGGNMYNVTYNMTVQNQGGINGQYDLTDAPGFDNDFTLNSASYTSNAPGNPGSALVGTGPWTLANDQAINAGSTHTYVLTVKVTLDLTAGSGGDNVYTKCGNSTPGNPNAGEGLYNESRLDINNDGIADELREVCADVPYVTTNKSIASINSLGGNMYNVTYSITVQNQGGTTGQYDLSDVPGFDDDISINSASYTSNAPGNAGAALAGTGPWTLANDQSIVVGATHTYTLVVKVTLDLRTTSGGNNSYTKCGSATPGDPTSGEGLYNQSKMDTNNDGTPEETKETCGDIPYITTVKTVNSITPLGGNMFNVSYQIQVKNSGGANGTYDLIDAPGFDNDFAINSSSYTSNAPGNAGSALAGIGPWTLANDQAILTGATHTYTVVVKVTLDLTAGSGGDNIYTACGSTTPGDPTSGEGLYNRARVDINNDGIPEDTSETCADVPYITSNKSLTTIAPLGGNKYNVTYTITVQNLGASAGQYDLLDVPAFDNDITIGSASYTTTAPGNAGGALAGTGPWTLANDQAIVAGGTHTYTLLVKVTLDLTAGTGGDNIYTKCGNSTPGNPTAGEGLYNESRMDSNNDGTPEETKKACGDLPYIVTTKTFSSKTDLGGNMYNVNYTITVQNLGGANGQYDLTDIPGFDDDITINNASYTSNAPGNGGAALAGIGPWTLANDQAILVGALHTYTLTVKVTLDLNASSGGNNTYTKCGAAIPGDPAAGEGLYNQSKMDTNNDGIPEETKEACGDLPYVSTTKTVASIAALGGNMFEVKYTIKVTNSGGANGQYDLTDIPGFDDDIAINSSSYASDAPGNSGGSLAGVGPWTLANDQAIGIGAIHTYTITVKVTIDLNPGSGGNNVYTRCGSAIPGDPAAGEGLYNQSRMDTNNDGIPEDIDEACGDLPYITSTKSITTIAPLGGNMYNVTYNITVQNLGAVNGQYDLTDIPGFDNDISIGSASFSTTAPGNPGGALAGSGPWTLANDQAITAGASHSYTITVKITLNLEPGSGGDDVYTKCGAVTPGDPNAGEGLYNQSKLDSNNDGVAEETKEACGDIPYVSATKTITGTTALGGNMYNVTYSIVVRNLGGAIGQYDLSDVPAFDNDIAIGSASYTTTAPGNPGGALAGTGPWTLANDQSIAIGATHTYTLTVKVTLDLNPGSGGDDTYTKCGAVNPGDPTAGEGLYNQSKLDSNNDGTPEDVDEACGDLPYVTSTKTITTITNLGGNMYNVSYAIVVKNLGGVNGTYDLSDVPGFDNDIAIGSASFTSTAPGNPGGGLAGVGPWTLANDQVIGVGATHTYTLTVKVTLDLRVGTTGDNIYTKCGNATPGDPSSGEGLYNQSRLDSNNDGTPEETKEACGDLPYIVNTKTVNSITPLGGNMFNVKYNIAVKNIGGANGQYDLTDLPGFDNDFAIGSASYTSDAPGNAGNALAGSGPWTLANDQAITVGATHNYIVTVKVTLDLSPGSGGDNVYTKCGVVNPADPNSGEGLYNQTRVDINNDGIPEDTSETCADIPYVTSAKTINSITSLGGHMYNVVYKIVVKNLGGAAGQYDLLDVPGFDNDITIGSSSYSSDAPGNAGGSLAGVGPWSLANDQGINANATHTYLVTVKVTLDLNAASGGDNIYTKCGQVNPNSPQSGEGLYNESRMDSNNDGTPEEVSKVCGDLPYVVSSKSVTSVTPLGGNMFNVTYKMVVQNLGGINGPYDLTDAPGFDDDITINTASYTTDAPGNPGGPLAGVGPWVLANDQNIVNGAVHTYNLTVKVTLNLDPASPGNNTYTKCGAATPGDPTTGEGLYNQAKLDINNDGVPEDVDEACGDVPYVTASKTIASITPLGANMYTVKYQINVQNLGGTAGMYDLVDQPGLDDDIILGSVSYTSDAPGNSGGSLIGSGPWTLANDQAIGIGSTHSYIITAKVTLDLTIGSSGDNIYTKCGNATPGDPTAGEGLYNQSKLDNNNDGIPEELDEVCGDLPYVTTTKTLTNISNLGGHMYNLTYQLEVKNLGGANGQYDLTDVPGFDNDISIGSASYVSTAPGNPGAALIGSGPWNLANDQNIGAFSTHNYTLTVKVTLSLETGSGGDDIYTKCGAITPGDPNSGEGLYNQSKMDSNNDGIPEELREACGDLPYVVNAKTIASITPLGGNMYNVVYQLVVRNLGGTNGIYDLTDIPGFDNDIVINSASFTTTGPGAAGALAGVGPWTLANDLAIASGATHTYTITVKVTIQMEGGAGNDVYTKCGNATPGDPTAGEGLYNQAKLDINNDGTPEDVDEACGDLPYVTAAKTVANITNLGGHMYNVTYNVVVRNLGGAIGQYDLNDIPGFDDDIAINSASFTSNAPGNAGGPLAGSGPWNLANDQNINANATHTYVLTVKVTIDLRATSGGDNIYTACGQLTAPGDPSPGEGLYNQSTMDSNNDGIPEEYDEACADLPYVVSSKTITSIIPLGGGMHTINYQLKVQNLGGAIGQYDLTDAPGFDNDLTINTASYTTTAPGNPGGALAGSGPWVLANDQSIGIGSTHTYNLTVKATLDFRPGSGGDNVYSECGKTTPGTPKAGEGVFNQSRMDINNDGTPEDVDDVCGDIDIVDMAIRKTTVTPAPYSYGQLITFNLEVFNQGNITLTSVVLNDYLPSGFTFSPADNSAGWSLINPALLEYNAVASIPKYSSVIVPLKLRVAMSSGYKAWFNYSEVKSYKDVSGLDRTFEELDSKPNSNTPAELAVLPGDPGDDNINTMDIGGNEDDHDPAGFNVFDLALRKISKGANPLTYGEVVPFEITLFNQGSISAMNPQVTDYVPTGFQFVQANNPTWTYNAGTREALTTYSGKIKPGDSVKLTINLTLLPNLGNPRAWDNIGEIETVTDTLGNVLTDFDSSPGGTKDDDGPAIDDAINDPNDQDDHDPSVGPVFDLALRKYVKNKLPYYAPGDVVPYTITVFNQGNITAKNIQVNDYMPQGYVFDAGTNPGWGFVGSTLVYNNIAKLYPGDSVQLTLNLKVQIAAIPTLLDWDNYAEIRTANDTLNVNRDNDDADSKPNTNSAWERQVVENHIWDNVIDGNGQVENEDEDDHDFENVKVTGAIGDRVWDDLDGDGIQDPGEPGLPNVIANLYDCNTLALVKKDTTDANGLYLFDFLLPLKSYFVKYDFGLVPPGYGFTFQNQGGDDTKDSDVDANGVGPCLVIQPGKRDSTYDAGLVKLGSFSDFVWDDKDGDGIQDPGEGGIQGVVVTVYNAVTKLPVKNTITDANGYWIIKDLLPQDYYIKFEAPAGFVLTLPNATADFKDSDVDNSNGPGTTATTHLSPDEDDTTVDAGFYRCIMVCGDVWYDFDMDGIYDAAEKGINGLRVYIIDAISGATVSTLTTSVKPGTPSDDGYFKAACLRPGTYYIRFERPGHLGASEPYKGTNPNKDSDISHENGVNTTKKFIVVSGDMVCGYGGGFQVKSVVGDRVWVDQNFNGIQDQGEAPLSGVKVSAYKSSGTMVSEGMTGTDGQFTLDGMIQGDYYVKFELPGTSYGFTRPHAGFDEVDSDVDGTFGYGSTQMYRIQSGEVRPTIDAGVVSQVLAVEWLSFDGNYNGSFTELDWTTRVDINTDHFVIERRHESETDFKEIGQVEANSDMTLTSHEYNFDDFDVTQSGVYYYRLKQFDKNGRFTYSKIISIRVTTEDELNVFIYPNPVNDLLKVELWLPQDTELDVRVFDQNGKTVLYAPFSEYKTKGKYSELLSTANLIQGQYILQIKTVSGVINKKFTVSR